MNIYEINVTELHYNEELKKEEKVTTVKRVKIKNHVKEITMLEWVKFHEERSNAPSWFFDSELQDDEEREALINNWTNEKWSEYLYTLCRMLSCFSDIDITTVLHANNHSDLTDKRGGDGLIAMYFQTAYCILTYQPKVRKSFKWKGFTYILPEDLVQAIGEVKSTTVGANIKTINAIEALQVEHVLDVKDEEGNHILENQKYHNDIALVSCLCRKVLRKGKVEQMPLDQVERQRWIISRNKLFKNLPMDIVLDVGFFLIDSKIASLITRTRNMRSPIFQVLLKRHEWLKPMLQNGTLGAG